MRRTDRAFRPADPQVAAPIWVWLLVIVLMIAIGGTAALYVILTGESLVG